MATTWNIGDRIQNRWEIYKILKGGMGIIYVVYDYEHRGAYAAKTFKDEVFARNPKIADRFTQEAEAWVNLDIHQNVTQARFVETIEGKPFLFLEYVSGGDLGGWIGTPRLTEDLPQVLKFAIQFCDGMTHALSKGIKAHRDIKPQNCLITEDRTLKVTDFGLAKVFDDADVGAGVPASPSRAGLFARLFGRREGEAPAEPTPNVQCLRIGLSRTGTAAGTCTHMAPEQFDDAKHVDVRADIYSFGVMLFQMVTGRLPFMGLSRQDFERLHKTQPPPSLRTSDSTLRTVVENCLAKKPASRFADFVAVREQLAEIYERLTNEPAHQPVTGPDLDAMQLVHKGVSLENLGRHEEGLACYNSALKLNPSLERVWLNKGAALAELERYEEALACHDRVLEINLLYAEAWSNKGVVLCAFGRNEEAIVCCNRALEINPRDEKAWSNKGNPLCALGRHDEALVCYDRALELNPRYVEAWANKGMVLWKFGRNEEAIACFDRALEINPYLEKVWVSKGLALSTLGRKEQAIDCYNRALKINPRDADVWYNKGVALGALGRYDEAILCFDRAIEIDLFSIDAWFNKGTALSALGRYEQALACYDRVLEINRFDAVAWCKKGTALGNLGRHEEAIFCFDRALKLNPRYAEACFNKGVALLNGFQRYREALTCFEEAQQLGHPQAAQAIALCRRMLGQR